MVMNKSLQVRAILSCGCCSVLTVIQEVNIQNMSVELVAQMFKNYQSNVLFHLEGMSTPKTIPAISLALRHRSNGEPQRAYAGRPMMGS